MQVINNSGPPAPPPPGFRNYGRRRKSGFFSNFGAQSPGFKINVIITLLGLIVVLGYFIYKLIPTRADAQEDVPALVVLPTLTPTVAGLPGESPLPAASPVLEPAQIEATAAFIAKINRPANQTSPYFVGVLTYETGCNVSNIGFTTSGVNGTPYYLYLRDALDRDPFMQVVQLNGFVQVMSGCKYPVIVVEQLFWMSTIGTPAPLPEMVLTGTATITAAWGQVQPGPTATPLFYMPTLRDLPGPLTPTAPAPTYTPYPTYTPNPIAATYTPYPVPVNPNPTKTPKPPTETPTPQAANINGPVISVGGCPNTNLAIATGPGQHVLLLFSGAQLPPDNQPTQYSALATGFLDVVCNNPAIKANSITWYKADPTATVSPTPTPTETPTATIAPTETPTATPTPEIAP